MNDERRCPVCQTLLTSVWICTMRNCPDKIVEVTAHQRKKFIDAQSGFGDPEIKDDDVHPPLQ